MYGLAAIAVLLAGTVLLGGILTVGAGLAVWLIDRFENGR